MPEEEAQGKQVDRSEFAANLAIYGLPFLAILIGAVVFTIEQKYGDTRFVQWVKTGRMDGAAENFVPDPEFDGERGNIQSEVSPTLEGDSVDGGVEGVYINDQFGSCIDINTDSWGYSEYYDPEKTEIETAWAAMQKLELIGSLGEEVVVIQGGKIRVLSVDSSELSSLANLTTICE